MKRRIPVAGDNICRATFGAIGIAIIDDGLGTLFGTQLFTN